MFLTGYHGTTLENAEDILKEGEFKISSGDKEWLGDGIYYYFNISDALNWKNAEAVLHSVVKIDDTEYLDIDTEIGANIYNQMIEYISSVQDKKVDDSNESYQKNQCAVMRILWDSYPKLKAVAAAFSPQRTKYRTLLDKRPKRREFCVRNNDCIKYTQLIKGVV